MFAVKPRVNLILDTLLLILFLLALISGLLLEYTYAHGNNGAGSTRSRGGRGPVIIQETTGVDQILGITRSEMDTIHLVSALAGGALVALHLVFHLKWIACQVRRLFTQSRSLPARHDQRPQVTTSARGRET
ncbi:MAG: DUF4405 domain-containing protein [Anaerolineae bacterium]|nr:DUF4405 domain-containing protein [Anaerolineae bacterium]